MEIEIERERRRGRRKSRKIERDIDGPKIVDTKWKNGKKADEKDAADRTAEKRNEEILEIVKQKESRIERDRERERGEEESQGKAPK